MHFILLVLFLLFILIIQDLQYKHYFPKMHNGRILVKLGRVSSFGLPISTSFFPSSLYSVAAANTMNLFREIATRGSSKAENYITESICSRTTIALFTWRPPSMLLNSAKLSVPLQVLAWVIWIKRVAWLVENELLVNRTCPRYCLQEVLNLEQCYILQMRI